ncbi:MAG TPA: TMEM175 family protein [Caulobacteraceae bacterium]|jgi:uncharacterized membrane protein|nr:TMEM175 family protein [Caulobacteraceae bacterium]
MTIEAELDADEPLEKRRHRHWYDRLMMLADGVFAIAITFLAFDIKLQPEWADSASDLWRHAAPIFDTYAMSFLVIAIYWLAHRRFMAMILTVDAPITVLTLIMLGLVVLLPPATRLIGGNDLAAARTLYGGVVIAIGLAIAAVWAYAALIADRVSKEVSSKVRWFLLALILVTPSFFLTLLMLLPHPAPGENPLLLGALFLIGWPLRLWAVRKLGGKAGVG